jgi:hypothetical protein
LAGWRTFDHRSEQFLVAFFDVMQLLNRRQDAIENGAPRYFTGKPCVHGHVAERKTSDGHCVECVRLKKRADYHKNKAKHRARNRTWVTKNRGKHTANGARWRKTNVGKARASSRSWAAKNPEKVKARYKRHYLANPVHYSAKAANRRAARLRRTPAWADLEKIEAVYAAAKLITELTGKPWHVDHIIPLQGETVSGLHVYENLQILPARENLRKHNRFVAT